MGKDIIYYILVLIWMKRLTQEFLSGIFHHILLVPQRKKDLVERNQAYLGHWHLTLCAFWCSLIEFEVTVVALAEVRSVLSAILVFTFTCWENKQLLYLLIEPWLRLGEYQGHI